MLQAEKIDYTGNKNQWYFSRVIWVHISIAIFRSNNTCHLSFWESLSPEIASSKKENLSFSVNLDIWKNISPGNFE